MPTEKEYMAKKQLLDTKQDKLTAGTNITISPSNIISATGGGSQVSVTQKVAQGENIADITIDGITTRLYASAGMDGNAVYTGTSTPAANIGEDGDLYYQYEIEQGSTIVEIVADTSTSMPYTSLTDITNCNTATVKVAGGYGSSWFQATFTININDISTDSQNPSTIYTIDTYDGTGYVYCYNDGTYLNFSYTYVESVTIRALSFVTKDTYKKTAIYTKDNDVWEENLEESGDNVSITSTLATGIKIADYEIDGTAGSLYAPMDGLRYFVETENTLYGRSSTSLFRCSLSQYYFDTTVTQGYTNGDSFEKANNIPAICLCTNFTAIGDYSSGGTIIISPNPLGVSFNATLAGVEYNTTYADTPSGDLYNNTKYEKGTYTDSDNNTWYWASIGGGGWQLVPVDNTIPFLTLADTGTISHEMDEIFATIEPEIFYPHNGIARNNNLAFFAGASDPTGTDAPIKIYADGTYEGIGGGSDVSITPTLATGTKIADYSIDGTSGELYAPTGGGGTGNVDDVYVNGTSVLDSNHIAQIKSYKELTQAEYDALPSSKLTDDIMYCITDAGVTEGDTFAPIIYSLEEREVGTWTDGKPLYQRSYIRNNITLYSNTWYNSDIYITNGIAVKSEIVNYEVDGAFYNVYANIETSGRLCLLQTRNTDIGITNAVITVWYTKTTDTPGSAQYTPLGVPAVHYDNTEKIIGTWFGETLYEKSYEIDSISSQDTIIDNITNLNNIILFDGTFQRDLGDGRKRWYQIDGRTESSNNNHYGFCWSYTTTGEFEISIFGYSVSEILKYRITIQYTKTN